MGCCGSWSCVGDLAYIFEKIAACCALTAVVSCIMFTIVSSIGIGVGIGYNYCSVERSLADTENIANSQENIVTTTKTTSTPTPTPTPKPTKAGRKRMVEWSKPHEKEYYGKELDSNDAEAQKSVVVMPISRLNVSSLLAKILDRNENVTVQFINM